jgi:hypothetical protein
VLKLPLDSSFPSASSGVDTSSPWRRVSGIPAAAEIFEVEDCGSMLETPGYAE